MRRRRFSVQQPGFGKKKEPQKDEAGKEERKKKPAPKDLLKKLF